MKCWTQAKFAIVWVARVSPSAVVFAEPVGVVERRIGEDVIGVEIGLEIVAKRIGVLASAW